MMHMTLYWGTKVTLLVDSWKTTTLLAYLITLFACFLFAAFYQYMENRRIRFNSLRSASASASASADADSPPPPSVNSPLLLSKRPISAAKFAAALWFGVNSAIGYLLMLAIMSFNGGVFLSIVAGLSVGYLLFRSGDDEAVVLDNPCACA